jgi:hypothetical protein
MAYCQPIRCGSRMAPTIVGVPIRTSGYPKTACSLAMTKSHQGRSLGVSATPA